MTNQSEDEGLRSELARIADYFVDMGQPNEGQDGWYISYDKKLDQLMALISQKIIEAEDKRTKDIVRHLQTKIARYGDGVIAYNNGEAYVRISDILDLTQGIKKES